MAVGPFSTTPGERRTEDYRQLSEEHERFLMRLWHYHAGNEQTFEGKTPQATPSLQAALNGNQNARSFLAIEIENAVSRKHLMGGIMNAVALGHLGIAVGWTSEKVRAMFRARAYLHFLEAVDKPTLLVRNLLILSREQADRLFGSS